MNRKSKLVCGIGINDYGSVTINGKLIKSYTVWKDMIRRCYNYKCQKRNPTYIDCYVCPEWLYFSKFKVWFDDNYVPGFDLDKDILIQGNKEYGPNVCRFVPHYLNSLLLDRGNFRGQYPLGVCKCKQRSGYLMQCNDGNGKQIKKYHKTVEEAVADYSVTKAKVVKQQAIRAFLDNSIKSDVYLALVRRSW